MLSPFKPPICGRGLTSAFHRRCSIAFGLAALTVPLAASAGPASLSLDEAQRLALARSRQVASHDYAAAAARDMAVAADQLPDPMLKAGIDNVRVSGPDKLSLGNDEMTMRRIGVQQEITRADKRQLRASRFELEAQKALGEKDVTSAAVGRNTAIAWLDSHYLEAMASVVAEQGEQARREVEAAEGAYRAGRGTQAELLEARSALALFDDRSADFTRRVRNARLLLARWVGEAAESPLAGLPSTDRIALDRTKLTAQLAHHPELALMAKQEQLAGTDVQLAQANRRADWTVEVAYQQRGSAYSNMVSVGVSVPLQWDRARRQDRELSAKLATAEQARAMREDAQRAHVAETQALLNEWDSNRARLARYQADIIPLAGKRTGATLAAYRGGKSSLAELLSARRNDIDVRLQALQLEADTARLWAQLNFLFPVQGAARQPVDRLNHGYQVSKDKP